jgi:predicted transcriptional regulator
MVKEAIPYKTVRRILKTHTDKEVTREGVTYVKEFVENLLKEIAEECIKEQEEQNRLRRIQKLPQLKRIQVSAFKRLLGSLFNETPDFNMGEVAQYSSDTTLSYKADIEVV